MPDAPLEPTIPPGRSVRRHLSLFALALTLPILVFVGMLLWQFATSERLRLERAALDSARGVTAILDRDLAGLTATLDALSLSAYLTDGNLEAFYHQAIEVRNRHDIFVLLRDPAGQQLVNTRRPWGEALPLEPLEADAAVLKTKQPYVTDLIFGSVAKRFLFNIQVPVLRRGEVVFFLNASVPLERLRKIILDENPPPGSVVSIVDRKGAIMARNERHDDFVGKTATRDLLEHTEDVQGTWQGSSADGTPVFGAYARSRIADWRVAVGVRNEDLNAPLWRSLLWFAGLGGGLIALSTLLAVLFGRQVTGPIQALADRAAALGRGEPVQPLATGLLEVNQVGAELAVASDNLRERETDLREANEESQRFAYIVSHDLRSPLVNIMGFTTELESLRQDVFARLRALRHGVPHGPVPALAGATSFPPGPGGALDQDAGDEELGGDFDEAIGFIKTSIGKMDRLINAILRLSREGRRDFNPERIDMEALIGSIRDSLAHQASAAGAEVVVGKLPAVLSDRLAVEQIFSNLIDNALKYLRRDVSGRIEIDGRVTPAGLVYDVRDNGRGIDPKDRERVFDLFRRSGVQDRPGEGIGLAHVRALVRRLGGTIALTSAPGRGSTFTITLPRRWVGERRSKAA